MLCFITITITITIYVIILYVFIIYVIIIIVIITMIVINIKISDKFWDKVREMQPFCGRRSGQCSWKYISPGDKFVHLLFLNFSKRLLLLVFTTYMLSACFTSALFYCACLNISHCKVFTFIYFLYRVAKKYSNQIYTQ